MAKKVSSVTVSLFDIMSSSTPYIIPYNQRPYTWETKNWEALWNSFFSEEDKSTFLGSLIFLVDDDPLKNIQIFDGQQRITTITILCKAFIDVLYAHNFISDATIIYSFAIRDFKKRTKLIVSKNIVSYFEENIQGPVERPALDGENDNEKDIFRAYEYFYKEAKTLLNKNNGNGVEIYNLLYNRLNQLEVVKLEISDILLGIEIFETVNATGKQLNASELSKNILIKHAQLSGTHEIEKIDSTWTEINDRLAKTGFSFIDFMHYYWISIYHPVGKNQLFQAMKKKFGKNSSNWMDFFSDLEETSKTFEIIYSCYDFDTFVQNYPHAVSNPKYSEKYLRYLKCLSFVKNKSWIIPIFTLLDYERKINKLNITFIGKSKLHEILKKHFVFSFLHFNVFSLATRDFTPAMYKLSRAINKALSDYPQNPVESNKAVNNCLQEHFTGKESYVKKSVDMFKKMEKEFHDGIFKLRHSDSNKFLIHNLFGEIEESIFGATFHNIANHSIEHYMPQESEKTWNVPKILSKEHENRLGNILIINANLNGKLQNKPHVEKMDILRDHPSNSNFTKEFVKVNDSNGGNYNFGKITKDNLLNSDPIKQPTEIDKRTAVISGYIRKMYLTDFKY